MRNRKEFSICPLSGWHSWEVGSSCTNELKSTHGEKPKEPISHVRGWFNVQIRIAVVRSYYHMICGYCLPIPLQEQDPDLDSVLGLGLAQ